MLEAWARAVAQLFAAAERVLVRGGAGGLTSLLHRHLADFDDFLAELVRDRIARLEAGAGELREAAGSATLVLNLAGALTGILR